MEGNERINQLLASLEQIHVKKEEDRRLLEEIKQALANNEIAEELTISSHTAKAHVCNIIQKLLVDDRTQAAVKALKEGLV